MSNDANQFDLKGKVAVVTGCSSGLGISFAEELLNNGAYVVICARREKELQQIAKELDPSARRVIPIRADVTVQDDVERLFEETNQIFKRLDILVNNAGMDLEGSPFAERIESDDFEMTIKVNLVGSWNCSKSAGVYMLSSGDGGSIINIASVAGLGGSKAMLSPGYSAAKAGIINLTQNLAANWSDRGVRVNCIAPGYFPSEMSAFVRNNPAVTEHVKSQIPLGRFGNPEELKGVLLLLASDASSYITGQTIAVDGGFSSTVGAMNPPDAVYETWAEFLNGDKGTKIQSS
ncbi:MAG: hypothetical protein CL904_05070 [Dehalococcoidia bacterium]|nr:hypothetical protein [Dehalococcoidia bacterium]MQG15924.1 SDR family oxidoreductase [SAR202 cluster bacterium]|tara:strand:+ start:299 stop:1171 length:873 start_codon:yes stop_codon:yes gene_type:complete